MEDLGAAEAEGVSYAFGCDLVAEAVAAADDDVLGLAPVGEFGGAAARAAMVRGEDYVAVEGFFGEDVVEAGGFEVAGQEDSVAGVLD